MNHYLGFELVNWLSSNMVYTEKDLDLRRNLNQSPYQKGTTYFVDLISKKLTNNQYGSCFQIKKQM